MISSYFEGLNCLIIKNDILILIVWRRNPYQRLPNCKAMNKSTKYGVPDSLAISVTADE